MSKRFLLIMAVCVLGFLGFLILGNNNDSETSNKQSNNTYGEGKSGVVFVEYADFECPGCYGYFPTIQKVKEKYKDQITFQFKHFPLVEIHQNALLASRAAEAAALQGKFWQMHDVLFQNQPNWTNITDPLPEFEKYANQIGMDVEKFRVDVKSDEVNKIVQGDRNSAKEQGFKGTPTFLIDGQVLEEPENTVEYFSEKIDQAINNKKSNQ